MSHDRMTNAVLRPLLVEELKARVEAASKQSHWQLGQSVTLSFYDLRCQYEGRKGVVTVLDRASGTIAPGSLVAMLGPSGAGKSTL
jgi:ABC-type transport system involved in cytochrome bd biosynthesis fused ATPase/permease subunit